MATHQNAARNLQEALTDTPTAFKLPDDIAAYNASLVPSSDVPTTAVTIAGIDVNLPHLFYPGMIFVDVTAKIANKHREQQYANNRNAAFTAWEKKAKAWDESTDPNKGERPANPCTLEKLLANYAGYMPNIGAVQQTSLEKLRAEAGLIVLNEMIDQHNTAVAANDSGNFVKAFGTVKVALKKGKGVAEEREYWVQKVLASKSKAERVQFHIDRLLAEAKATKPEDGTKELARVEVDLD